MNTGKYKKRLGNIFVPVAILVAGLAIAYAIYANRSSVPNQVISVPKSSQTKTEAFLPVTEKDHILGDISKAELIIVDYSDLQCPYCKEFHETIQKIYDNNANTGKVAWVFRHFPLSIHDKAGKLAEAVECVSELGKKDEKWKFIHSVFEKSSPDTSPDLTSLPKLAKDLSINEKDFSLCLDSGKYAGQIQESYSNTLKMTGEEITPFTVLVSKGNPIPVVDTSGVGLGALPYATMNALVNQFLTNSQ